MQPLIWSFATIFGAFLGLALHIVFSWGEWNKLTGKKMSLSAYLNDDPPGFFSAVLLSTIAYFGMPELAKIELVVRIIGFQPGLNFFSAAGLSYITSSLGYKLRAWMLKKFE